MGQFLSRRKKSLYDVVISFERLLRGTSLIGRSELELAWFVVILFSFAEDSSGYGSDQLREVTDLVINLSGITYIGFFYSFLFRSSLSCQSTSLASLSFPSLTLFLFLSVSQSASRRLLTDWLTD